LPKAVSISHAALAEIFFCINVSIAFFTSRWYHELRTMEKGDAPVSMAWGVTAIVYLQILAGAVLRHFGAGLAIPDFPLSFGRVVPRFFTNEILAAYVHRVGGFVVAAAVSRSTISSGSNSARHHASEASPNSTSKPESNRSRRSVRSAPTVSPTTPQRRPPRMWRQMQRLSGRSVAILRTGCGESRRNAWSRSRDCQPAGRAT